MIPLIVMVFFSASFFWLGLNFILSTKSTSGFPIGFLWCIYFLVNSIFWIGLFFLVSGPIHSVLFSWIGPIHFHLFLDQFSVIMGLLVGLVSFSVMLFSLGYIPYADQGSFFRLIGFFAIAMQSLLLSGDLLSLLFFWEMIGAASFLLIGFFHTQESLDNSFKVFIFNRLGDALFVYALAQIYDHYQTFDLSALCVHSMADVHLFGPLVVAIMIKSAQWPLHIWLPLSMSAPTPVSALLHAATLVTAGVYLYSRLFALNPEIWAASIYNNMLLFLASMTIILGGVVAIFENHIKVLIAYSTISQIAYALVALCLGLSSLSYYHLWTHGFFKALLFLCAALATHYRHSFFLEDLKGVFYQDRLMRWMVFIGLLSLIGCPPFGGFYSKERIIHWALTHEGVSIFVRCALVIGAFQTAIYSARLGVVFFSETSEKQVHRSSTEDWFMRNALVFLSVCTLVSGPAGEYMGFLGPHDDLGWVFIEEAIQTGWVIVFVSVFWVFFRIFKNLPQWTNLKTYQGLVTLYLSKEFYWPEYFFYAVQYSYHILAQTFDFMQKKNFEDGIGLLIIRFLKSLYIVLDRNLSSISLMHFLSRGIVFSFLLLYGGLFL